MLPSLGTGSVLASAPELEIAIGESGTPPSPPPSRAERSPIRPRPRPIPRPQLPQTSPAASPSPPQSAGSPATAPHRLRPTNAQILVHPLRNDAGSCPPQGQRHRLDAGASHHHRPSRGSPDRHQPRAHQGRRRPQTINNVKLLIIVNSAKLTLIGDRLTDSATPHGNVLVSRHPHGHDAGSRLRQRQPNVGHASPGDHNRRGRPAPHPHHKPANRGGGRPLNHQELHLPHDRHPLTPPGHPLHDYADPAQRNPQPFLHPRRHTGATLALQPHLDGGDALAGNHHRGRSHARPRHQSLADFGGGRPQYNQENHLLPGRHPPLAPRNHPHNDSATPHGHVLVSRHPHGHDAGSTLRQRQPNVGHASAGDHNRRGRPAPHPHQKPADHAVGGLNTNNNLLVASNGNNLKLLDNGHNNTPTLATTRSMITSPSAAARAPLSSSTPPSPAAARTSTPPMTSSPARQPPQRRPHQRRRVLNTIKHYTHRKLHNADNPLCPGQRITHTRLHHTLN